MTGMTVICETCNQPIDFNQKARHRRDCLPGEPSPIAVVPPEGEGESEAATDRHGRVTVGDKREHPWCSNCERDVFSVSLKQHKGRCHQDGEPSDIGVVEEGTIPKCVYCEERIERENFEEHARRCGVSNTGSDYGVSSGGSE